MQVCRKDSYREMPWKNGGGSTTEIIVSPAGASLDDFDWRISMARIERDGPFSSFPGIDRTLTLLDGPRVELRSGDVCHLLTPASPTLRFPGEHRIDARISAGPITDFNVMTRRARCRHRFALLRLTGKHELAAQDGTTLVFLAEGDRLRCEGTSQEILLARRDCLVIEPKDQAGWRLVADPAATIFLISIELF